jgi:hypothetical protein
VNFLDVPMLFEEALSFASEKHLLPTELSSAELSGLSSELKQRSIFSARMALADPLQQLQDDLEKITGGPDDEDFAARARGEKPLLVSIPDAKANLLRSLRTYGYVPTEAGLKDHTSDARLQLIVETNVLDTLGFGQWKAKQNAESLIQFPAWKLTRLRFSKVPRDWPMRWNEARYECGEPRGATDGDSGEMIALINHPIWRSLGDPDIFPDALGNPWAPFAFNSGMGVLDVHRDEARALGLVNDETEKFLEPSTAHGLNDSVQASTGKFDDALMAALLEDPNLEIRDGVLRLKNRIANARETIAALLDGLEAAA